MLLNIERMSTIPREEIGDVRDSIEKVSFAGKRFGAYLSSIRSAVSDKSSAEDSDFETELEHVKNLLSFAIRERSATIKVRGQRIGEVPVESMKIHQILLNLISNAVDSYEKAADSADKVVTIEAHREKAGIRIIVRDHGMGIAPADLPRIFEPFFTTKEPGAGTGIGLATVRRIIDEIGATISIESAQEKGTTATVIIPL